LQQARSVRAKGLEARLQVVRALLPGDLDIQALALGLSIVGVVMGGAELTAEGSMVRLLGWVGVTAAYAAFWFALPVAVNALGRSSGTNAITLAGLWLLFVVVMPSVLNVALKAAYPVPSRVEMIQAMRVAGEESTRKSSQLLARYLEDHPELAPAQKGGGATDYGTLLIAVNEATERSVQPVIDEFDRQLAAQNQLVDRFRYLSPAIVAQTCFNDLAGSGSHRYKYFLAQVDRYHKAWRDFLAPRIVRKEKLKPSDLDDLPEFTFREEETGELSARVATAMAGLLLSCFAVGFPAFLALRRYPVAG